MNNVIAIDPHAPAPEAIEQLAACLSAGGAAVIPTDSVYGIACAALPGNPGHERIFAIKHRERAQTLPLLVFGPEALEQLAAKPIPPAATALAQAFWPGALTLVVRASAAIPPEYVAADGTVALRAPAAPVALAALRELGAPLACTSANLHGEPAATSAAELAPSVVAEADLTLDGGPAPLGVASTIVDCTGDDVRILRAGAVDEHAIGEVLHGTGANRRH